MRQQTLAFAFHTLQDHEVSIDIKMHFIEQSVHASCKNGKRKADALKSVNLFYPQCFPRTRIARITLQLFFIPFIFQSSSL